MYGLLHFVASFFATDITGKSRGHYYTATYLASVYT